MRRPVSVALVGRLSAEMPPRIRASDLCVDLDNVPLRVREEQNAVPKVMERCGFLSFLPKDLLWAVAAGLFAVGLVTDAKLIALDPTVLGAHRQVPQSVFAGRARAGTFQFGVEMGSGVRTYLTAFAPIPLAAAILFGLPGVGASLAMGACFGLSRGTIPVLGYLAMNRAKWFRSFSAVVDADGFPRLVATFQALALVLLVVSGSVASSG